VAIGGVGAVRGLALTVVVTLGYFAVWSGLGAVVFPLGALLASAQQRMPGLGRAMPIATGVVVLIAGLVQLTEWKTRHLVFDRDASARAGAMSARVDTSLRHGVCLGVHCTYCCAGLTASLLALGVMDLRVMAVVTAAITAERLAPAGARVARAVGVVGIVMGTLLIVRAVVRDDDARSATRLFPRRTIGNCRGFLEGRECFLDGEEHRRLDRAQGSAGADRECDGCHRDVVRRLPEIVSVVFAEGIPESMQLPTDRFDVLRGRRSAILRIFEQARPGLGRVTESCEVHRHRLLSFHEVQRDLDHVWFCTS
jgi:hypothetical protein